MTKNNTCSCDAAPKLVFPCSGAADVGEIADHAARKLTRDGAGKMFCLAGLGGRVSAIMEATTGAAKILAIDGCALKCAAKTLEEAGFGQFQSMCITDLGFEKGTSPATDEAVSRIAEEAERILQA
jgi:uncharacterized metal-binding protein